MKKIVFIFALCLINLTSIIAQEKSDLLIALEEIPQIKNIKVQPTVSHFNENYEFYFEQKVDPSDSNSAVFLQKIVLGHFSIESPTIFELEGYSIHNERAGELPKMFKGNQIAVEHRFFKDARPEGDIPWKHLTIENAALDHHLIIQAIRKHVYKENKFISTGISKGGQTTMIHRSFYPEDVDVSVCYVAPLNFKREDERIYQFLNSVGTEEQRKQIFDFQTLCLKNKKAILPMMEKWAKQNDLSWFFSIEKAFEYYVLEYSFAFWQWGSYGFNTIPDKDATPSELLSHVLDVSGISFFEKQGVLDLQPYFWAALTQEGIYGYEYKPFEKYLSQQKNYTFDFAFPEGMKQDFDPEPMKKLNEFVQNKGERMIFINGGLDTWGSTGVELSEEAKARGLKLFVNENGHHGTRIGGFPFKQKKEILKTLEEWLEYDVVVKP